MDRIMVWSSGNESEYGLSYDSDQVFKKSFNFFKEWKENTYPSRNENY